MTLDTAGSRCQQQNTIQVLPSRKEIHLFSLLRASASILIGGTILQSPAPTLSNALLDPHQKDPDLVNSVSSQSAQSDSFTTTPQSTVVLEKVGHGVSAPIAIKTPPAKYTREARKNHIQGTCIVAIIVDANGIPQQPKVVRSLGYGLDESALSAVAKYRFSPAKKQGHPVPVKIMIKIDFKLL